VHRFNFFVNLFVFYYCVIIYYSVIINYCPIAVGVGDVVECAASLLTWVRLVSPIGGAPGGNGNQST
jgi:hypothetical protein